MVTYAVLAAGESKRMGHPKATTPLAGVAPLARLAATLRGRRFVIVSSAALTSACEALVPGMRIVTNPEPWRGMSSSLRAAHRVVDAADTLGVLLADMPFVDGRTLVACERALETGDGDVVFPISAGGEPGHPVYFRQAARRKIEALPDGDTLRSLRDDPSLTRSAIACADEGAFMDLDTLEQWRSAEISHGT